MGRKPPEIIKGNDSRLAVNDRGGFLRHEQNYGAAKRSQSRGIAASRLADHNHNRPTPSLPKLKFMGEIPDGKVDEEREDRGDHPGQ